jgi:hypothetical protein
VASSNLGELGVSFDYAGKSVWQGSCVSLELLTERNFIHS